MPNRRQVLQAGTRVLGLTALAHAPAGQASTWPSHSVKVVCPYGPGGGSDVSLRVLTQKLGEHYQQSFVVENKPGASTRMGYEAVARAAGDGYSLLYAAATYATVEALFGKLNYDPRKDLLPIVHVGTVPLFLIVNASSPVQSVADLVQLARSRAQGMTFATPAAGSVPHLACELFMREAKAPGLCVHLKGDAASFTELLAGRVDACFTGITAALPHIKAGSLRVLATSSPQRNTTYPQAATTAELGLPKVQGSAWYGFMAPKGTAADTIASLNQSLNTLLHDAPTKARLLELGVETRGGTPAEFAQFIAQESKRWANVIAQAKIVAE